MAKLFSTAEAAKFLGVSVKTLRRWKKSGVLVPEKMGHKGRGKWDIYSREQLNGIKNGTRAKLVSVMEEKNSAQIQERLKQITQPNDKLATCVLHVPAVFEDFTIDDFIADVKSHGKFEFDFEEKSGTAIKTAVTIKFDKEYRASKVTDAFDNAVLFVCISELKAGNNTVTLDRIYRGLTGGKSHDGTRMTHGMETAIFESVKHLMKTLIEVDASEVVEGMKYPDMPKKLVSSLLPAEYEERLINGQVVSAIHFFKPSPLYIFACSKNHQLLIYNTRLLAVPNLRHTPRVIGIKFYLIERVVEIVTGRTEYPTITFKDLFEKCGLAEATWRQKQETRKIIVAVLNHLKEENFIEGFDFRRVGGEYQAITILKNSKRKNVENK